MLWNLFIILLIMSVFITFIPFIRREFVIAYYLLVLVFFIILAFQIFIFLLPVILILLAINFIKNYFSDGGNSGAKTYFYYKTYSDYQRQNNGTGNAYRYHHYSREDDYETLGVKQGASPEEIKKALAEIEKTMGEKYNILFGI